MTDAPHPRPRLAVAGPLHATPARFLESHADCVPYETADRLPVDGYVYRSTSPPPPPHLPAEEDDRLSDPALREHFIERIFAHARLREFFAGDWRPRDLIAFHSRHKLQILAHDPTAYRNMGRIVAQAGTRPPTALETEYRRAFTGAFAVRPERGRHTNALHHVLGPLTTRLAAPERHEIVAAIAAYHQEKAPLSTPVDLLRHYAEAKGHTYLAEQTYLSPYPAELRDRG